MEWIGDDEKKQALMQKTIMYTLRKCVVLTHQTGNIMHKLKTELKQLEQIVSCGVGVNKKDK